MILLLCIVAISLQGQDQKEEDKIDTTLFHIKNNYKLQSELPFLAGEMLEFKAMIGWVKAAEATFGISDIIYTTNEKPTYRIDINARTVGIFDFVSSVRDNWGTYVDTTTMETQQFYRYIKEGRFRKNEIVYFDHQEDSAHVAKLNKEDRTLERTVDYRISENVQDMVSSFYYLRAVDWSAFEVGDIITINVFFDDKLEPQRVKILRREVIKTKLGNIKSILLIPIREKDSLFVEENTVKVWLSDDLNKIPLKVKAKIYVGYLTVDLKEAKNLKHPLALVD
jgi:hypothetical protein